jgi:hypothetical protein
LFATHAVPCVDLRASFAGRFQFTEDPSLMAERADRRNPERAWLTRIPCADGGFIAPAGGRRLLAYATSRRRRLRALSCVTIEQEGTYELIASFDVADLEAVAAAVGARQRRRLSDERRAQLKAAGAQTRFSGLGTTRTERAA